MAWLKASAAASEERGETGRKRSRRVQRTNSRAEEPAAEQKTTAQPGRVGVVGVAADEGGSEGLHGHGGIDGRHELKASGSKGRGELSAGQEVAAVQAGRLLAERAGVLKPRGRRGRKAGVAELEGDVRDVAQVGVLEVAVATHEAVVGQPRHRTTREVGGGWQRR